MTERTDAKVLKPEDLITEEMVDKAINSWLLKNPKQKTLTADNAPVLKRLMKELVFPLMDRSGSIVDEDSILGNRITSERNLYLEITKGLPGGIRGRVYKISKTIAQGLFDGVMTEVRKNKFNVHPGFMKGDPEHTSIDRGISGIGGRSSYTMDSDMNPNGYAQGLKEV